MVERGNTAGMAGGDAKMKGKKMLPIGIENYENIRSREYYYVDKTGMIRELLESGGAVNLFTRPRRFGKSLNMSMLKYFFGYDCNPALFEGLEISKDRQLCEQYMGKFPVISVTLKGVEFMNYETARAALCAVVGGEALRFQFLESSDRLSEQEREQYRSLVKIGQPGQESFVMTDDVVTDGLRLLSELLCKHYGQKTILLIDEYDVPLDKAQHYGYYDQMLSLIRRLLSQALKSNDSLFFAVLTGCLRVSRESIFTGLNNLNVLAIENKEFSSCFGFTDEEVREMLAYYGCGDRYEAVKEWYDGYLFGDIGIYCPWDVINYVRLLRSEPDAEPKSFWINTSGNDIIRNLLGKATQTTRLELQRLVGGESIERIINRELTYRDLYSSVDNLWSVLYATGYLTVSERPKGDMFRLVIPNQEIRQIYVKQIMEWIQEEAAKDTSRLDCLCAAFEAGDAKGVEESFGTFLTRTISIRDSWAPKGRKENFYHGVLLGLLAHREDWAIFSNVESGEGFSDILIESGDGELGIVIEVKYPDGGDLEKGCQEALEQIERLGYEEKLKRDDIERVLKYGIACNRKKCRVAVRE